MPEPYRGCNMKKWLFRASWMLENVVRCKQWRTTVMDPLGCQRRQTSGGNIRDGGETRRRRGGVRRSCTGHRWQWIYLASPC